MLKNHNFYKFMLYALILAEKGRGKAAPNPVVGAVLVKEGKVVAEGWHRAYGQAHAEVEAINAAKQKNIDLSLCTLVVTLEPCNHYGKTPPCTKAILDAKIKHVIVGCYDQNLKASGGVDFLRQHGIKVEVGIAEDLAEELIADFKFWQTTELPYLNLKLATSLDGYIATRENHSKWLTGTLARQRVQALRVSSQAVLIGGNTFRQDNPRLTVRLQHIDLGGYISQIQDNSFVATCFAESFELKTEDFCYYNQMLNPDKINLKNKLSSTPFFDLDLSCFMSVDLIAEFLTVKETDSCMQTQPYAVIISSVLPKVKDNYYLIQERAKETIFFVPKELAASKDADELRSVGVNVLGVSVIDYNADYSMEHSPNCNKGICLEEVLKLLRQRFSCYRILCEGGGKLAFSLLQKKLVQNLELHIAPLIIADKKAVSLFERINSATVPKSIQDSYHLKLLRTTKLGEDLVVSFR